MGDVRYLSIQGMMGVTRNQIFIIRKRARRLQSGSTTRSTAREGPTRIKQSY